MFKFSFPTTKYISIPLFFISFIVGLFFIYVLGPEKKVIYVYPSPENIDKVLFKDKANNCFTFEEKIVDCPVDESNISQIPIQT